MTEKLTDDVDFEAAGRKVHAIGLLVPVIPMTIVPMTIDVSTNANTERLPFQTSGRAVYVNILGVHVGIIPVADRSKTDKTRTHPCLILITILMKIQSRRLSPGLLTTCLKVPDLRLLRVITLQIHFPRISRTS